ncbi:type VII secretion protein EccB [Microlunatus sp. Y2014]|uniref:type VII secretion protein EccB n=1 Tax=Microlunatus sp. Y2014 TaxID=3418488 RepID=UPI003DA6E459
MASRKDLLKAYKFTSNRLVAALVDRNPDRVDSPLRRIGMGTFASIMIGIVIMAGFGVVGLINPGNNTTWKEETSLVVIDSEAGQVFWYRNPVLHPMENITSAKLASNGAEVRSLKSKSLTGVERGAPLGITGAPRQLPNEEQLGLYPLQVCATAPTPDGERHTTVRFGETQDEEEQQGPGTAVPVVLTDAEEHDYLVVDGTAHLIPRKDGEQTPALVVLLGYPTMTGAYGLLSTLPVGSELSADRILDGLETGQPSSNAAGEADTVGDLVHVRGGEATYLMLEDGLSRITPLEHKAVEADTNTTSIELSSAEVSSHLSATLPDRSVADLPTTMPEVPSTPGIADGPLCATWESAESGPVVASDVTPPEVTTPNADPRLADAVVSEPGRGALLANSLTEADPESAVLLVEGQRFGIPDAASLKALGYGATPLDRVSPAVINLIPMGLPGGTVLSIDAAGRSPE